MKLFILHLSDLHISEKTDDYLLEKKSMQLFKAINSLIRKDDELLIVSSGDIAFSGKKSEYLKAKSFFDSLINTLNKNLPGIKINLFFTPGNHDCNFLNDTVVRRTLINNLDTITKDNSILQSCTIIHEDFFEFSNMYKCSYQNDNEKVLKIIKMNGIGFNFEIHLINTALVSNNPEKQGTLRFPVQFLDFTQNPGSSPDFILTTLHHPFNWFEQTNSRQMRKFIESTSDIVLSGHEHEIEAYLKLYPLEESIEFIEGGVFFNDNDINNSKFNLLQLSTDDDSREVFLSYYKF